METDDGATVHIFNCKAYAKAEDENLKVFLKYVQTDKAEGIKLGRSEGET